MVLADLSKAFDTIKYKTVLKKLNYLGFSKSFLNWTIEYLTDRWHFVQVDDKTSDRLRVNFGMPQGSIMGSLIFNLYVADLHANVNMQCHQYADDTTLYVHCKPSNLESYKCDLNNSLCNLEEWSSNANLVINPSKIKMMVLSTKQLSSAHAIENLNMKIEVNNENIERVRSTKRLGTYINQHLKWEDNVKYICTSCYSILAMLRKVKNLLPFHIRKNLAQALVLSKLYYNDFLHHSLPEYLAARLHRVQKAAASFVNGKYATTSDILKLYWLPVIEQREWHIVKSTQKSLYSSDWPIYLRQETYENNRNLRSSKGIQIANTFQDEAANLFNDLPLSLRNCMDPILFFKETRKLLQDKAKSRL